LSRRNLCSQRCTDHFLDKSHLEALREKRQQAAAGLIVSAVRVDLNPQKP
jgi:hypothetical protein